MNLPAIPAINDEEKTINVIIETPAGSSYKYAYDNNLQLFKVFYIQEILGKFAAILKSKVN